MRKSSRWAVVFPLCFSFFFLSALDGVLPLESAGGTEAPSSLNLDRAISLALENNLNLKKNLLDLSGAEYSAKRIWSELFPSISGSAGIGYGSPLFSGGGFTFNEQGQSYSAALGITLGLNAGIPFAMKNIRLAYRASLLNYEDARNQLAIQITKNFYSLITEKNNLAYLEDILALAERQHERNRVAFNNGLVGELVLMQSSLSVENARYNLSAAGSAHTNRRGEFFALLGLPQNSGTALEGEIAVSKIEVDEEALIREHLFSRPDIVSRRREIERLKNAEKQNALSSRAPSLSLQMNWNSGNFDPFADTLRGSATLNIPVDPWIPGTKNAQSLRNAKLSVEKAELDLKIAENAAITQIHSLAANLRDSWDSVEIARLSLEVAERGYALSEQGFRNGAVESLVLEDARNNLANARQRLLQSELSYLNMTLDLSAALNIDWKNGVFGENR